MEIKERSAEHSTGATLKEGNEDIREQEQAKNVKLFLRESLVKIMVNMSFIRIIQIAYQKGKYSHMKLHLCSKILLLFSFSTIVITGCFTDTMEWLPSETNKVIIHLYGKENDKINQTFATFELTSKEEIKKAIQIFSDQKAPKYKCGYHGAIHFYKNNVPLSIEECEFNINPDCSHIVFIHNGELLSYKLTQVGFEYLNNLYKSIPEENRIM